MNIFVLDRDPDTAARYHCDKHVVKMILESAQIMSTVHYLHGEWVEEMYRPTHMVHPCTIWAAAAKPNYDWLYSLFVSLAKEFKIRYKKNHQTFLDLKDVLKSPPKPMSGVYRTPFALAMPSQYKRLDEVEAYRTYYVKEKSSFAEWSSPSMRPEWFRTDGQDMPDEIRRRIRQLRSMMLIHSYLYYEADNSIITDDRWQHLANELAALQTRYGEVILFEDENFRDWTGSSGHHLKYSSWIADKARSLARYHQETLNLNQLV